MENQNCATDNQKLQIMGKRNENNYTINESGLTRKFVKLILDNWRKSIFKLSKTMLTKCKDLKIIWIL